MILICKSLKATVAAACIAGLVQTAAPVFAEPARLTELPAPAGTATLRVAPGSRIVIPLPDVTRILPDDHEVARAAFENGKAVLEGVNKGKTFVEVYQANNKRTLFAVQVETGALTEVKIPVEPVAVPSAPVVTPVTPAAQPTVIIATNPTAPKPVEAAPVTALAPAVPVAPSIVPADAVRSNLAVSLRVAPVEGNPFEAVFTVLYSNRGTTAAQDTKVRFVLSDAISYVTGSAVGGGKYDAAARALTWDIGSLPTDGQVKTVTFRVAPIDKPQSFYAVATIEDSSQVVVSSNTITYGFTKSALLTVFALPDRILAGRQGPVLTDVKTPEVQANVDRLQKLGVVSGAGSGMFLPEADTKRAEYAVMTLNGLNLRDLRDVTAIKFVLAQPARVTVQVLDSMGRQVAQLAKDEQFPSGEHTRPWDGTSPAGYVAPGRYTYVCNAKSKSGQSTTLRGFISVMPQTPLEPIGRPSFVDVKPSDWYSGYLAIAEKQNLVQGFPDKSYRPQQPINRVEATAIIVRAMGLEDAALKSKNQDSTFLDYQNIPGWAVPYVNIATQLRTTNGKTLVRGIPGNLFMPGKNLRRDEAAMLVHRMIDNGRLQQIHISGSVESGATVTINNQTVVPNPDGQFSLVIQPETTPASVAVIDKG